jgi:hypothetical protein
MHGSPPQNGNLLRQRKNQTACLPMTACPGFFRFLAFHHSFSGLRILNFSVSLADGAVLSVRARARQPCSAGLALGVL